MTRHDGRHLSETGGTSASLKLGAVIVGLGLTGIALVGVRELQTRAAHDLIRARVRIIEHDRRLWDLRAKIAREVSPPAIARRLPVGETRPADEPESEANRLAPLASAGGSDGAG